MDEEDLLEMCGLSNDDFLGIIEDEVEEEEASNLTTSPETSSALRSCLSEQQNSTRSMTKPLKEQIISPVFVKNSIDDDEPITCVRPNKETNNVRDEKEKELNLELVKAVEKGEITSEDASKFSILSKGGQWALENARFCCETELAGLDAMAIDGLLTHEECDLLVQTAEQSNHFSFWSSDQSENVRDFRNVDTIEMTHQNIANELWERVKVFLGDSSTLNISEDETPERHECDIEGIWDACGTNTNLLFSRYSPGGHFAPHTDGYSVIDINHRSMYTVLLYLNDCCTPDASYGGTRFYDDKAKGNLIHAHDNTSSTSKRYTSDKKHELSCVPAIKGRCLLFYHNHIHEGTPPAIGHQKYIIRSDVMYARRNPICTLPQDIEAYNLYRQAVDLAGVSGREKDALPLFQRAFKLSRNLADVYGM